MEADNFFQWGQPIGQDDLRIGLARELLRAIGSHPFAAVVEVRRDGDSEGIVADFQVELPQDPPVAICSRERVALVIGPREQEPPHIMALRRDFPEVGHLNLTPKGAPNELCIFEEHYADIKASLTARLMLDRIADWLARAAIEELHLSDQPLEPFLLTSARIIFDPKVFVADPKTLLETIVFRISDDPLILRAFHLPDGYDQKRVKNDILRLVLPIKCAPWHARLIHHLPGSLLDLCQLLTTVQVDLENEIRQLIARINQADRMAKLGQHHLALILQLPKIRKRDGQAETTEWWSFLIHANIENLAIRLGIMGKTEGKLGTLLGVPQSNDLDKIEITAMRPTFALSKEFAQQLAGGIADDPKITAVGAGALGSQVMMNLARQGFARWTIIDHDHLLPHNLARHALYLDYEGRNKAESLAHEICALLNDEKAAQGLAVDFILTSSEECLNAARNADLLLDFSASPAVARFLAHAEWPAGRLSAFLAPNGRFLIVLAEGQDRALRLDDLEMQLMADVVESAPLQHVFDQEGQPVRYAGSCRDASVQVPQDHLAIFAGVAANFIKRHALAVSPSIGVWEWSDASHALTRHQVQAHRVLVKAASGWTLRISGHALDLMRFHRRRRLPNETGGVLLGQFDHDKKLVYIACLLPSPPDSVEWPQVYIRGAVGLRAKVETINKLTGGGLSYVGEWHTHPSGVSSEPSADDRAASETLADDLAVQGLPAVILIQGEELEPSALIVSRDKP